MHKPSETGHSDCLLAAGCVLCSGGFSLPNLHAIPDPAVGAPGAGAKSAAPVQGVRPPPDRQALTTLAPSV